MKVGKQLTSIIGLEKRDHHYRTIPVDDPQTPYVGEPTVPAAVPTPVAPAEQPAAQPVAQAPVVRQQYEPMTGAVSSGGVDSAPVVKKGRRSGKSEAPAAAEAGTYVVKSGDTLERIARRHGVRLNDLMKANDLDDAASRKIHVGRKLVIPAKSSGNAAVKSSGKKSGSAPAAEADNGKYRVKPGDTPDRIARRYKIKVSELLKANNLDDASARKLQVGQELVIPGKAAPTGSSAGAPANPAPKVQKVTKPAPADQDKAIPAKENNDLDNPQPTSAASENSLAFKEVDKDMTFAEFAAQCGLTEKHLRDINGGTTQQTVKKGDCLFVPKK